MVKVLEGDMLAGDGRFGIVASRFNDFITSRLLEAAISTIQRHGGSSEHVTVAWVPGSMEVPLAARRMAASGDHDAVICLGCVIQGATAHHDHVAAGAREGIGRISIETGVPTIFGIVTAQTIEQAIERAGTKQGNAGENAARAAIEMVNLLKKL